MAGLVGVHILKLLSGDEVGLVADLACDLGIAEAYLALCISDSLNYGFYGILEKMDISLLGSNDLFPVPLVNEY